MSNKTYVDTVDNYFGDYVSEKEMCDQIELMIEKVAEFITGEKLIDYKREFYITTARKDSTKNPRADFRIKTKNHNVLIEAKNTTATSTHRQQGWGLGQLLTYGSEAEDNYDILVLATNEIYDLTVDAIKKYNLPITQLLITKTHIGKWSNELQNEIDRRKHGKA